MRDGSGFPVLRMLPHAQPGLHTPCRKDPLTVPTEAHLHQMRLLSNTHNPPIRKSCQIPSSVPSFPPDPCSGLVFHLLCTQNHSSGRFLIISSTTFVNLCVLTRASASLSPVFTTSSSSKTTTLCPVPSLIMKAGTTAAPLASARMAGPLLVKALCQKKSTKKPSTAATFWSTRMATIELDARLFIRRLMALLL